MNITHGTYRAYRVGGCRCVDCRKVANDRRRLARQRQRRNDPNYLLVRCPICDGLFEAVRGYPLHQSLGQC